MRGKQGTVSGYRVPKAIRMRRTLASIACAPATSESGEDLTKAAKVATVGRKSVVKVITKLVVPVVHAGKVEKRLK